MGKEFSGNIVCIDPSNWEIKPNPEKQKQKIVRAIDKIKNNSEELINFIQKDTPRELAYTRQDLEFAFGYYYIRFLDKKLDESSTFEKQLSQLFIGLTKKIHIPDYIVRRNLGTSVIAQQSLFEYFSTQSDIIETLIPVYPEDINAYNEYSKLVGIIGSTISYYPSPLNNPRAILLINWMRGRPLNFLIASSYRSYQSNPRFKTTMKLPTVIRNTMDDVENFVRFRFAKDSSCYIDVLRYFLEINNRSDLLKKIPDLSLWLEFGVSQKTHLSLLALGITRNSVIELSEYITNSEMSKSECLVWLRNSNLEQLSLSPIIIDDIKKAIQ